MTEPHRSEKRSPQAPVLRAISGRPPPHNLEAEQAVLSALMLKPEDIARVRVLLEPSDFYSPQHKLVCEAIYALDDAREPIDLVLVAKWLRGKLNEQGTSYLQLVGPTYLGELIDKTPAIANVVRHAAIVRDMSQRRRMIDTLHRHAHDGYGDVGPSGQQWLEEVAAATDAIARDKPTERAATGGEAATEALAIAEQARERGDEITGTPTGIAELDKVMAGLHPDLILITGKTKKGKTTGCGKTAFALNTLGLNVLLGGRGLLVFSLEDPKRRIGARLCCTIARVDASKLRRPTTLTDEELAALQGARDTIARLALRIDDRRELGLRQIRARALEVRQELARQDVPLGMVVVDNLQRTGIEAELARGLNETRAYSDFGKGLVALAEDLECPVALVAQLNKAGRIKGCTAVEEHAQVWLHVQRDDKNPETDGGIPPRPIREPASVVVRKMRDDIDAADIGLWWHGPLLLFSEQQWLVS